jgi:hypothetical protein
VNDPIGYPGYSIGDIADVDGDGTNELLVTHGVYGGNGRLELYSWDGNGFSVEATVHECTNTSTSPNGNTFFHGTIGDLDDDGTPEILFQCYTPEPINIFEYRNGTYPIVGAVTPPPPVPGAAGGGENVMVVDDMETGDVNGDGVTDAVFCGNSGQGHVLTYRNGAYLVEYSSPAPVEHFSFSQTCSVGDMTNDGQADFLVINKEGAKVYSHDSGSYEEVWVGLYPRYENPRIGASFIGDADNDGFNEFLFLDPTWSPPEERPDDVKLYENDIVGASSFQNTYKFEPTIGPTIIIANLNPTNDEPPPMDCDDTDPLRGGSVFCGVDYSRPAAGSGGGEGGTHWSDEFTVCNTSEEDRELLFRFIERGDPGQSTHTRAETILADACITYTDPVQEWFGEEMYGAFLIDVMDGPAQDIAISGIFKGETGGEVMGQFLGNVPLEDAVTGDAYIITTPDPERNRLGTGFQATQDGTSLKVTLENPIGTRHWRKVFGEGWAAGDNEVLSKIERHGPGVPNLIIHYTVTQGAVVPFGTITDNQSGDSAARLAATPSTYLVIPVIGATAGAAGVDWRSEVTIANLGNEPNTVRVNLYLDQALTAELHLDPGEVLGYNDLVGQIDWVDADGHPVPVEQAVGALEIVAQQEVIAGSKFDSVNRATGEVMGLSLKAMAEPNILPGEEYLFLGVRNEDETGVVRARLNFTNLNDERATLNIDVLDQNGALVGSFEKTARKMKFNDWRIPTELTEVGATYTLRLTSTQSGYATVSQMNESNDAISNYPLRQYE